MIQTNIAPGSAATLKGVVIRPATSNDADEVYQLITENLVSGQLLPRSLGEVQLHVHRFRVAAGPAGVIGCGELARLSTTVAEVRSLVVVEAHRGQGLGRRLLEDLVTAARQQGFPTLCAYTHQAHPFVRTGFSIVPHPWVPEKIATDCHTCRLFRRCHQYAVVLHLGQPVR